MRTPKAAGLAWANDVSQKECAGSWKTKLQSSVTGL